MAVIHPEGSVDPLADIETIETELALWPIWSRRGGALERVARAARSGSREAQAEESWLREVIAALGAGARRVRPGARGGARRGAQSLGLLTAKPVLFVANVDEGSGEVPAAEVADARRVRRGAAAVAISARTEAELVELDDEEAAAMRAELGVSGREPGWSASCELRSRCCTSSPSSPPARPSRRSHGICAKGAAAWEAAGEIHSDIQKGFVRAEVIGWRELVDAGGYAGARERGSLRLEGRDYVMRDGDVITVRFTP